jgi:hypothetical protein
VRAASDGRWKDALGKGLDALVGCLGGHACGGFVLLFNGDVQDLGKLVCPVAGMSQALWKEVEAAGEDVYLIGNWKLEINCCNSLIAKAVRPNLFA